MLQQLLVTLRTNAGLRQIDLAKKLRCSQAKVSAIELGVRSVSTRDLSRWLAITKATDEDRLKALDLAGRSARRPRAVTAAAS